MTSRSTRWPAGSRTAPSSTHSAASTTSPGGSCARSARRASRTTRCDSCAPCGSSPSSTSTSRRRPWPRCEAAAPGLAHVSAERIGGGIKADGQGELSKLLLGQQAGAGAAPRPRHRRPDPRDPGVRARDRLLARLRPAAAGARRAPVRGRAARRRQRLQPRGATRRASARSRQAARREGSRRPRLPSERRSPTRSSSGSAIRRGFATTSSGSSPHHGFTLDDPPDARDARRFLAEHGDELARDLIDHKAADLGSEARSRAELAYLEQLRELVAGERSQPHRLADLAVTGDDLRAIGFAEGPSPRPRPARAPLRRRRRPGLQRP